MAEPMNLAALQQACDETQDLLQNLTSQLDDARQQKASKARALTAAQEELRRAPLLNFARRNQLKADITRLTSEYTAASKHVSDLQAQLEQQQLQLTIRKSQLAKAKRAAMQSTPVTADAPAGRAEPVEISIPVQDMQSEPANITSSPAMSEAPLPAPAAVKSARKTPPAPRPTVSKTSHVPQTSHVPRQTSASPQSLQQQTERFFARLESYYPEHRVYALDSISTGLRAKLASLAAQHGHATSAAFLAAYGWQEIRGEEVLKLRKGKHCIPGQEPEIIRPQVESMLRRLAACYPAHVIPRSIQHDHKSLAQDVTGLYQWLGYESARDMLSAYGYQCLAPARGGRPAVDTDAVISALTAAYADIPKPVSISQLMQEHPEYASALKTLQNNAPALYGTPLRQHLLSIGLLSGHSDANA